jgi:hypothetical protein
MSTDWSTLPLLDVLKIVRREQEVSRMCIQTENEENLSGFDELTVMDRHPVRKIRKTRREVPILLAALQVYCCLWSHLDMSDFY